MQIERETSFDSYYPFTRSLQVLEDKNLMICQLTEFSVRWKTIIGNDDVLLFKPIDE